MEGAKDASWRSRRIFQGKSHPPALYVGGLAAHRPALCASLALGAVVMFVRLRGAWTGLAGAARGSYWLVCSGSGG